MEDQSIPERTNVLVAEEHDIRIGGGGPERAARLRNLQQQFEQCWDLLRHRQARAELGENPDDAQVRSQHGVESYVQKA
jgi:hypothetical protein